MNFDSLLSRGRSLSARFAIAAAAAVAVLPLRPASAYVLEGGSWAGHASLPVQVQLGATAAQVNNPPAYPLLDGFPDFDRTFMQAVRFWNQYIGAGPGPVMTPTIMGGSGSGSDGLNSIFFSNTIYGDAFGNRVLAVTVWNGTNVAPATGMDIIFNTKIRWNSYRGDPQFNTQGQAIYDLQRVAIHELGHFLGLDHPDEHNQFVNAIMNSTIGSTDIMQKDDIQGVDALYHGVPAPVNYTSQGVVTNLSTRLNVLTGASLAIPGFIITGTGTKKVLVRAIGPSLALHGVPGALQNPTMELHDAHNALASNTGWKTLPQNIQDLIVQAGQAPEDDRDCAMVMDLPAGPYTVLVRGVGDTTGVGRVDVIDLEPASTNSRLTNVATRGQVQTGDNVMIGGFIINGTLPKRMMIRAVGPSLAAFNVPGVLADPTMTIYDANQNKVYINNDWMTAQAQQIQNTPLILPSSPKESAVIINLPPGAYTVIVSGVGNTTGNGRVDIIDGDFVQ